MNFSFWPFLLIWFARATPEIPGQSRANLFMRFLVYWFFGAPKDDSDGLGFPVLVRFLGHSVFRKGPSSRILETRELLEFPVYGEES